MDTQKLMAKLAEGNTKEQKRRAAVVGASTLAAQELLPLRGVGLGSMAGPLITAPKGNKLDASVSAATGAAVGGAAGFLAGPAARRVAMAARSAMGKKGPATLGARIAKGAVGKAKASYIGVRAGAALGAGYGATSSTSKFYKRQNAEAQEKTAEADTPLYVYGIAEGMIKEAKKGYFARAGELVTGKEARRLAKAHKSQKAGGMLSSETGKRLKAKISKEKTKVMATRAGIGATAAAGAIALKGKKKDADAMKTAAAKPATLARKISVPFRRYVSRPIKRTAKANPVKASMIGGAATGIVAGNMAAKKD